MGFSLDQYISGKKQGQTGQRSGATTSGGGFSLDKYILEKNGGAGTTQGKSAAGLATVSGKPTPVEAPKNTHREVKQTIMSALGYRRLLEDSSPRNAMDMAVDKSKLETLQEQEKEAQAAQVAAKDAYEGVTMTGSIIPYLTGEVDQAMKRLEETEANLSKAKKDAAAMEEQVAARERQMTVAKYERLRTMPDFGEKSKYVSTRKSDKEIESSKGPLAFMVPQLDTLDFGDITYDYINRNEEAVGKKGYSDAASSLSFAGVDSSFLQQMTEEEVAIFNYLYALGTEAGDAKHTKAYQYIKDLTAELNAKQRESNEKTWAAMAQRDPVGTSVFSVLTSPMKGLSYIGQAADIAADGKIDQNAGYNKFSYIPSTIRGQVSQDIEKNVEGFWGKAGSFAYQTGMSMGDFLLNTAITGGNQALSLSIMGTGAAADATIEAKDRGLDDTTAFTLGTIAGAAEIVTEKLSLDALLEGKWEKNALQYVIKNMITEGSEEVASDLINATADVLLSKDKSHWRQAVAAYVAQGYDEGEALGLAARDAAMEMGMDFLGGALSGGVMAGARVGIGTAGNAVGNRVTPQTAMDRVNERLNQPGQIAKDLQGTQNAAPVEAATAGAEAGVVMDEYVQNNLTGEEYQRLDRVAKLLGTRVRFVDSVRDGTANANISANGAEVLVERNNPNPVNFLLGHEWTHRMQQIAPTEYQTFLEAVAGELGGEAQAIQALYHEKGVDLDAQGVMDEAAANYAGRMLEDGRMLDEFIQRHREDRTLLEKLRDAIRAIIDKLTGAERRQAQTAEGKLNAALDAAAQQAQTLPTQQGGTLEGTGERYSLVGKTADGIEVYETSQEVKALPYKERIAKFQAIMEGEYSGRTARFDAGGQIYYAKFDSKDLSKNIYGDKKSSPRGWKAKINTGADGGIFDLIEHADYYGPGQEKGKAGTAHKGVTGWEYFIKTVQIDGRVYDLLANVRKKADGEYVYSIQINESKTKSASPVAVFAQSNPALKVEETDIDSISETGGDVNGENLSGKVAPVPMPIAEKPAPVMMPIAGEENAQHSLKGSERAGEIAKEQGGPRWTMSAAEWLRQAREIEAKAKADALTPLPWSPLEEIRNKAKKQEGIAQTQVQNQGETAPKQVQNRGETQKAASTGKTDQETYTVISKLKENISAMSQSKPVAQVSVSKVDAAEGTTMAQKAHSLFEKIKGIVTRRGFGEVEITDRSAKDDLSHGVGAAKAAVIPAIPSVIEKGMQIDFQSNWKGRAYDGYIFAAPVTMDGRTVYVAAVVKQTSKNRFYLHEVVDSDGNIIKISNGERAAQTSLAADGDAGTQSPLPLDTTIPQGRQGVNTEYAQTWEKDAAGTMTPEEARTRLDELGEEYGTIEPGENPVREVSMPKRTEKNKKLSQTVRTVMEAAATPESALPTIEILAAQGEFSYKAYGDERAIADAEKRILNEGWARTLSGWMERGKRGEVSKQDTALGWALYNNAVNKGDVETALDVLDQMVVSQRSAAQALQATRILKKLSPEAQLYQVQRSVANLQSELNERYGEEKGPKLKIDPELGARLMEAQDQTQRDEVLKDIYRDIGRQMPSKFRDKWNAWRYLAMLGNPRTHVRNILGNAGFAPVVAVKDLTATAIESAVYRVSGGKLERSKALVGVGEAGRELLKAAWGDYAKVQETAMGGGKYSDLANANKYIEEGRIIFKSKALETARKANSRALDAEDAWFSQPHYAYALAQFCKANGITAEQIAKGEGLDKARAYAVLEAQKATYRDSNALSQMIAGLGKSLRSGNTKVSRGMGMMVEGILPFRKTPANILARGLEYSPLGLVSGVKQAVWDVQTGKRTGAEAIDRIAAGLTGTGLMALGMFLAAMGTVRGHGGGDEDENKFMELMGHQSYALELPNGTSVTLDWLAPECLSFFVGVNLWEQTGGEQERVTLSALLSAVGTVTEPLLEMSCLQSLNDIFDAVGYASSDGLDGLPAALASAATSYLTQALPTILGQVERTAEDKRYTTYTERDAFLTPDMQYTLGRASARIPGWDFQQIPYIDAWGRTETTGSAGSRAFNNFLDPAYISQIETSPMEDELLRLYRETGEGRVLPERAAKYFTVEGQRKDLTAEEYVEYATKKGNAAYELLEKLTASEQYRALDDMEKVRAVAYAYDLTNQTAKSAISDYKPESWVQKAREAEEQCKIPVEVSIILKTRTADIESLTDEKGETIANSKGLQIMEAVYTMPGLTEKQRLRLFEDLGVGKSVIDCSRTEVAERLAKMRTRRKG